MVSFFLVFAFFGLFIIKHTIMTNEEIKRAEQIREIVREAINKLIDEEYSEIIKEIGQGKARLSDKDLSDIVNEILSPEGE